MVHFRVGLSIITLKQPKGDPFLQLGLILTEISELSFYELLNNFFLGLKLCCAVLTHSSLPYSMTILGCFIHQICYSNINIIRDKSFYARDNTIITIDNFSNGRRDQPILLGTTTTLGGDGCVGVCHRIMGGGHDRRHGIWSPIRRIVN